MGKRRIGAYGGTFDPVHLGHIEIARAVTRNFELDQMLLIPACKPPHKDSDSISSAYHRYAMAVLATADEPRFLVSSIEIEAPDRPFTYETVERLLSLYGAEAELYFVMGADSFEEINTWREPSRLLSTTNVVVAARPGVEIITSHLPPRFSSTIIDLRAGETGERRADAREAKAGQKVCFIYLTDYVSNPVSSTEIRQRVRDGQSVSGLVPPRVADYIEKYQLYRR